MSIIWTEKCKIMKQWLYMENKKKQNMQSVLKNAVHFVVA